MYTAFRICRKQPLVRFLSFSELGVNSQLVRKLDQLKIVEPTLIQKRAIPIQLENRYPIAISSETGSGKTLAYLLPFLNEYKQNPNKRLIVTTPRKELAYQLDSVLHELEPSISSAVLVGKSSRIERGVFPNVIIGTADPIHTYVRKAFRKCDVETLSMYQRLISQFVMDEADILLNDPFKNIVLESFQILRKVNKDLKVVAAGATLPRNGRRTAGGVLETVFRDITWVEGEYKNAVPANIDVDFVEREDDTSKFAWLQSNASLLSSTPSLVFVKNAVRGEAVAASLRSLGVKVQTLSQDGTREERERGMKRVVEGASVCTVCTDILSRGVDTTHVKMVVQFDFARDVTSFLHRCGRTGRHGTEGKVVCLITAENELLYRGIKQCGVHADLSSLYSRKRMLRKKEKKRQEASQDQENKIDKENKVSDDANERL